MKHTTLPLYPHAAKAAPLFATIATLVLASWQPAASAQSDEVYLCINAQGQREYKNTGNVKGCKRVELLGLTTVPAPKMPTTRPTAAPVTTPTEFPKVDPTIQKARDNDRRRILQDELQGEEAKLANLKQEYKGGEPERRGDERNAAKYFERVSKMAQDIASSEKNIEALKREISNLR